MWVKWGNWVNLVKWVMRMWVSRWSGWIGWSGQSGRSWTHLTDWSVCDVKAQSSATVLEKTRLKCRKWKRRGFHWRTKLKFLQNLYGYQLTQWAPPHPSYTNRNKRRGCASANRWSVWLAQPEGLVLLILRTEVTENIFLKGVFTMSVKLY